MSTVHGVNADIRDDTIVSPPDQPSAGSGASRAGTERSYPRLVGTVVCDAVVDRYLAYSEQRFREAFGMSKLTFHELVSWLRTNTRATKTPLVNKPHYSAEYQVLLFLHIVCHGHTFRETTDRFNVDPSIVESIFCSMIKVFLVLYPAMVYQPDRAWLDPEIELTKPKSYFNGCIGAIDSTYFPITVPADKQNRYRDREGNISQNVFAAVGFDCMFYYSLAGATGATSDPSLQQAALDHGFQPGPSRFYLADDDFDDMRGYMVPFPDVRYHPQDWRNGGKPINRKETYNYQHSRLHATAERAFDMLKQRFAVLRSAKDYTLNNQIAIIYVTMAIHNWILVSEKAEMDRHLPPKTDEEEEFEAAQIRLAAKKARIFVVGEMDVIRKNIAILLSEYLIDRREKRNRAVRVALQKLTFLRGRLNAGSPALRRQRLRAITKQRDLIHTLRLYDTEIDASLN